MGLISKIINFFNRIFKKQDIMISSESNSETKTNSIQSEERITFKESLAANSEGNGDSKSQTIIDIPQINGDGTGIQTIKNY